MKGMTLIWFLLDAELDELDNFIGTISLTMIE